jgi:hypothetical protein
MECLQQEIVKLNQIGIELYQLHKAFPASFHFNEASITLICQEQHQSNQLTR